MSTTTRLTAITGGIGAGKSVVSHILSAMGYPVYDCDREAKKLMDTSGEIKAGIASAISADAINPDGTINRPVLAGIVFSDPQKLAKLNSLVHGAVCRHLAEWALKSNAERGFVETAILSGSGIDTMTDTTWVVEAPESLRVNRVMTRSGLTAGQVAARMAAQPAPANPDIVILNDGQTALIPQIEKALSI